MGLLTITLNGQFDGNTVAQKVLAFNEDQFESDLIEEACKLAKIEPYADGSFDYSWSANQDNQETFPFEVLGLHESIKADIKTAESIDVHFATASAA